MHVPISAVESLGTAPPSVRPIVVSAACALGFGVLTQALLWSSSFGAGWSVWVVGMVAFAVVRFGRGRYRIGSARVSLLSIAWCAALVGLALACVLRASQWSLLIAIPAALPLLASLPFVLSGSAGFDELGRLPLWVASAFGRCPTVLGSAKDSARSLTAGSAGSELRRAAVGVVLGVPLSLCFVALFSADPRFSAWLHAATDSSTGALSFAARAGLTAGIGAVWLGAVHRVVATSAPTFPRLRRMVADGRRALGLERTDIAPDSAVAGVGASYRSLPPEPTPAAILSFRLPPTTWLTVLAQLVIVFAVFVAAGAPELLRGHAYLQAAGTVTYAQYLHAGFAELTLATVLSVIVVLVGQRALASSRGVDASRRTLVWVGRLELTLLGLTVVTLAMCAQRLALYQEAYGATYLRLGVRVFQSWMLLVLGLTAMRVRRPQVRYTSWLAALTTAVALVAATFNADLYIARTNVARLAMRDISTAELDIAYLAMLSDDAAPVLHSGYFSANPEQKQALETRWRDERAARGREGWRAFRGVVGAVELGTHRP